MDIFFCFVLSGLIASSNADDPIVETDTGKVLGTYTTIMDGKEIFSFFGIPYAEKPRNELRFADPIPIQSWVETKDATQPGPQCFQGLMKGSEAFCLHLNVHTGDLKPANLKPVMVWIHGGGFVSGSNAEYGPEFLLTEDIVYVAINYRLGIFGFLSLYNTTLGVPGNAGLKDQTLALKWIQRNIKQFGGNPDDVTIFGQEAGGASVHYHILSEASKGLFHKAIIQSGSVLNPWAMGDRDLGDHFTKYQRRPYNSEATIMKVLREYADRELLWYQERYRKGIGSVFGPTLETPSDSQFIVENPLEILKSGNYNHVPLMIGYCSNEAIILEDSKRQLMATQNATESVAGTFLPSVDLLMSDSMESHKHEFTKQYFVGKNMKNQYLFATDALYITGILASAEYHMKTSTQPVYLYKMSLDAGRNYMKKSKELEDFIGVSNGDDLGYLFNFPDLALGTEEKSHVEKFVKLWTNFAKYGNPTPEGNDLNTKWKPLAEDTSYFLDIGQI
ncbi:hypothetical protein JTB14_028390 [Gonioctena quinquepunctata]|nr:hypothetical protein JTB14_028390 [Gonioctena quinquepunctata]